MSRIHPDHDMLLKEDAQLRRPAVLTVWKRSSMSFQGTDGFTVFDHHGRLAFRVDNYSRKSCCITGGGGLVLMDGAGKALLTLKPQRHSSKDDVEAIVVMGHGQSDQTPDFRIEGCFRRRNCKIKSSSTGQMVAKIARKRVNNKILLGDDVFTLAVQPGFDTQLVMAFVIILDRICGKPFAPVLCS
ncbi:hypothetical protein FH972_016981 [Carpinus fangiana]|uniref:Tubby C-terminal domain-containing protein n=1 Tax=Carpinus fangiana TaxID=176857 RepID=A0A5N6RHK6_9ROSI|nr:hypothetical protein FH972_016981 [Carpinus fangiana]